MDGVGEDCGVMRRRRYLAPWARRLEVGPGQWYGTGESKAEAVEALRALEGKPAIYHCISRVVDRRFILGDAERERFVNYLRAYEAFCQVRVLTFCVMSNHFHVLVEVPARPVQDPDDEALLKHLTMLYSGRQTAEIRWQLEQFRSQGDHRAAEVLRQKFLSRMWDLSAFMQSLKRRFAQWYNLRNRRDGCLWSERFKSVLVEDGHAARVMAAYIDLNPVRAGMVATPEEYRWSGYGEAVAGKKKAREGLRRVMFEKERLRMSDNEAAKEVADWRKVAAGYRMILLGDLVQTGGRREGARGSKGGSGDPGCGGRPLSEAALLRCRVRYFTDGLVLGSREFVEQAFALTREHFGARRRNGARKLAGAATDLRSMRALQVRMYG